MLARRLTTLAAGVAAALLLSLPAAALAADTKPPSVPKNLRVLATTDTSLKVAWDASTDNVGVVGYRVFRNGTLVASPTVREATLTGLKCATDYIIMVSARDAAGNKSLPAVKFTTTAACPPATPPCPTPSTVLGLLLEHKLQYGCLWPDGWAAKQAVQSIRFFLAGRAIKLETWRGRKWHREALDELDAATDAGGAWSASGALQANKYGAQALGRIHRAIRILHYHNDELFLVSRSETWALAAVAWYITASEYNRHFKLGTTNPYDMAAALTSLKRGDEDFFASNNYRAAGRYITGFRRLNQLF